MHNNTGEERERTYQMVENIDLTGEIRNHYLAKRIQVEYKWLWATQVSVMLPVGNLA